MRLTTLFKAYQKVDMIIMMGRGLAIQERRDGNTEAADHITRNMDRRARLRRRLLLRLHAALEAYDKAMAEMQLAIDRAEAIPDPGDDFDGCLEGLARQATNTVMALFPPDLDEQEMVRRRIALAGYHYRRMLELKAPDVLVIRARNLLDMRLALWAKWAGELPPVP